MATSNWLFPMAPEFPEPVRGYPMIRYMGSKYRLLPWIHDVLSNIPFESALDAFSGSGCVGYLLKCMGKRVVTCDLLRFCATIATALVENPGVRLSDDDLDRLIAHDRSHRRFIEQTFQGIFFTPADLRFLDNVCWNLRRLEDRYKRALATAALIRACVKRQPRGVFTVAGDPDRYKDDRRDLRLSIREHFVEQVSVYNRAVVEDSKDHRACHGDVFELPPIDVDLVYLDPPYVPRSDDNCYMKRYHFLEGLSSYWSEGELLVESRVRKLKKRYTPFSYRKSAAEAFDRLFERFSSSVLVLSYSSNGFPDLPELVRLMQRHQRSVEVFEREHRYHFGTHARAERNRVREYLLVGFRRRSGRAIDIANSKTGRAEHQRQKGPTTKAFIEPRGTSPCPRWSF